MQSRQGKASQIIYLFGLFARDAKSTFKNGIYVTGRTMVYPCIRDEGVIVKKGWGKRKRLVNPKLSELYREVYGKEYDE